MLAALALEKWRTNFYSQLPPKSLYVKVLWMLIFFLNVIPACQIHVKMMVPVTMIQLTFTDAPVHMVSRGKIVISQFMPASVTHVNMEELAT